MDNSFFIESYCGILLFYNFAATQYFSCEENAHLICKSRAYSSVKSRFIAGGMRKYLLQEREVLKEKFRSVSEWVNYRDFRICLLALSTADVSKEAR